MTILPLLVIVVLIVFPVLLIGYAMCKSAALADRKLDNLRAGILSDDNCNQENPQKDIPTTPVRSKLRA